MKKIVAFVLLYSLIAFSLCGCAAKKSDAVLNVESLISNIGIVTIDSESAIIDAENAYNALSSDEKNKVENFNVLLQARNDYNAITKDVTLTPSNIKEYLAFEFTYSELNHTSVMGVAFSDTDVQVNIYPIKGGSFSDVKLDLEISCPSGWSVSATDRAYKEDDQFTMYIPVTLPSNGNYTTTVHLTSILSSTPSSNLYVSVASASGSFHGN